MVILDWTSPLRGLWTPAESELISALVMCVLAHKLLRPLPLNENPGSAPETGCSSESIGSKQLTIEFGKT